MVSLSINDLPIHILHYIICEHIGTDKTTQTVLRNVLLFRPFTTQLLEKIKKVSFLETTTLDVLKWALANGFTPSIDTIIHIAKRGDLELLDYVYTLRKKIADWQENSGQYIVCYEALRHGHVHILEYMRTKHDVRACDDECLWYEAAISGHLHILQYFHTHSPECWDYWGNHICDLAAQNGHQHILEYRYTYTHGSEWKEDMCCKVALNGHIHILQYLHTHGCYWDEYTCNAAALSGNLACLKYAHENGCPWWYSEVCACALQNGHQDCLEYARAQAGPA